MGNWKDSGGRTVGDGTCPVLGPKHSKCSVHLSDPNPQCFGGGCFGSISSIFTYKHIWPANTEVPLMIVQQALGMGYNFLGNVSGNRKDRWRLLKREKAARRQLQGPRESPAVRARPSRSLTCVRSPTLQGFLQTPPGL